MKLNKDACVLVGVCFLALYSVSPIGGAGPVPTGHPPEIVTAPSSGQEDKAETGGMPAPLSYGIPKDAEEVHAGTLHGEALFAYKDRQSGEVVGKRTYINGREGQIIKEEVWYKGKLHGVQREWYENGQLKNSSPYRMGVMDGVFEFWSESGKRTGYDKILNGAGVLRHYYENGRPMSEEHYKDSLTDGPCYEFYEDGQAYKLKWRKISKMVGQGFIFWPDGSLQSWWSCGESGKATGPILELDETGKVIELRFDIEGESASKETYAAAADKDPKLPRPVTDPEFYKKKVTKEIQDIIDKYKVMPPVKIPIGPEGPVPASDPAPTPSKGTPTEVKETKVTASPTPTP